MPICSFSKHCKLCSGNPTSSGCILDCSLGSLQENSIAWSSTEHLKQKPPTGKEQVLIYFKRPTGGMQSGLNHWPRVTTYLIELISVSIAFYCWHSNTNRCSTTMPSIFPVSQFLQMLLKQQLTFSFFITIVQNWQHIYYPISQMGMSGFAQRNTNIK